MASIHIGPTNRNPDYGAGEHQYAFIVGADTFVLVPHGGGCVHRVQIGVAGTLAKFYDTPTGGTADATTQIATVNTSAPATEGEVALEVEFSKGLTVVTTGASTEITVSFRGAQTVSSLTFGT